MLPHEVVAEVFPTMGGITAPTETYMPEGYAWVTPTEEPSYNRHTQRVVELPPQQADNSWVQSFMVEDLSAEEILTNLQNAKATKIQEINATRLAANFGTFTHAGKVIACDELSRSDIDGTNGYVSLFGTMPENWPGGWKAVDNSYIQIANIADWKAFYISLFNAGNSNFGRSQNLKVLVNNATTIEQVLAITWTTEIP